MKDLWSCSLLFAFVWLLASLVYMPKPKVEMIFALFQAALFFAVLIFMHKELGPVGCAITSFGLFVAGMYAENAYVRSTWVSRSKR